MAETKAEGATLTHHAAALSSAFFGHSPMLMNSPSGSAMRVSRLKAQKWTHGLEAITV